MNDSKIKVLLVEPEKYPKEIEIDDSLEAMQEVVGGDIEEYMPYDDDIAIICNEEGKVRGLPLNRAVYVQDNDKKEIYLLRWHRKSEWSLQIEVWGKRFQVVVTTT